MKGLYFIRRVLLVILMSAGGVFTTVDAGTAATLTTFVRAGQCYEQKAATDGILIGSCAPLLTDRSVFDARSQYGSVGATGIVGTNVLQAALNGRASAYFSDELNINVNSGKIVFAIDVAGQFFEELPGQFAVNGGAYYSSNVYFAGSTIFKRYRSYNNQGQLVESEDGGALGITYHTLDIVNGAVNLSAAMTMDAQCLYGVCTLGADFFNSARFIGAEVFDANGMLVENAQVASASGFDYLEGMDPHVPAIPLPAGFPLLLCAAALLARMGCRRTVR